MSRRVFLFLVALSALLTLSAGCGAKTTETVYSSLLAASEMPAVSSSTEPGIEESKPETTTDSTPEPVSPDSALLPDPALFFGQPTKEPQTRRGGLYLTFTKLPIDVAQQAAAEYAELLQNERYQLELTDTFVDNHTDPVYSDSFDFDYTGTNPDVTQISNTSQTQWYNVHFSIVSYRKLGTADIAILYSSAFTFEDPGVRTTADLPGAVTESSGGSGSIGGERDPNIADFARSDCLTCGGSGDCTRCGGSGYIFRDGIRSSCSLCHGSGDCSSCGGSGKR